MANIFIQNYGKAGSGIAKNDPKRRGAKLFFEIYGTHMWKLFGLNFIYLLFCIPVVTIGPATAAMVKVLKDYSIDKHVNLMSDFWSAFKQNFGKAFVWGLINILSFFLMTLGTRIYSGILESKELLESYNLPPVCFKIFTILTLSIGIFIIVINFYYFLMLVSTNLKFSDRFKNSLALVFIAPKQNIFCLLLFILIPSVILGLILTLTKLTYIGIILFLFFPFSFIWFTVCFNCYPIVQKYVINPYYEAKGEVNPELQQETDDDDEEVIFKDMGGQEAPTDLNGGNDKGFKKKKEKMPATPKGKVIK